MVGASGSKGRRDHLHFWAAFGTVIGSNDSSPGQRVAFWAARSSPQRAIHRFGFRETDSRIALTMAIDRASRLFERGESDVRWAGPMDKMGVPDELPILPEDSS